MIKTQGEVRHTAHDTRRSILKQNKGTNEVEYTEKTNIRKACRIPVTRRNMRGYILVYSWLQERTCNSSGSQQRGLNFFVRGTPKRAEENRMLWGKSKLFKHPQVTSFTLRSFRQTKRNPTTSRTSHLTRHSFRLLGDAFYSRSATASQPIRKTVSLCL